MPMKISNAILLLVVCVVCAAFNMQLFGGLDEMNGLMGDCGRHK